ncbi:MAG: acetyl-CoA carboxylase biotin carboxyl carrier protein [Bacteroidota bacterium]
MEFKEIQDILKLVNRTDLTEVEIEKEGFKIKIRRKSPESNVIYTTQPALPIAPPAPASLPAAQTSPSSEAEADGKKTSKSDAAKSENAFTFRSPMIGTFYRAGGPESPPFVKVGDQVSKGQVVCIIEAMKLFNEIESEVEGKVVKILVENAQPVEYDQPLFLIELS